MQCKELVVDEASNGQCIKGLHEELVYFLVVFIEALCSKVKELSHLSALVIASQHVYCLREVKLKGVQQKYYFT